MTSPRSQCRSQFTSGQIFFPASSVTTVSFVGSPKVGEFGRRTPSNHPRPWRGRSLGHSAVALGRSYQFRWWLGDRALWLCRRPPEIKIILANARLLWTIIWSVFPAYLFLHATTGGTVVYIVEESVLARQSTAVEGRWTRRLGFGQRSVRRRRRRTVGATFAGIRRDRVFTGLAHCRLTRWPFLLAHAAHAIRCLPSFANLLRRPFVETIGRLRVLRC